MTDNFEKDINVPRKEPIMIDGVEVLKEKINMCFILLLNKLETPETIEQTIYKHLDAFVKEWNTQLARKTQECEELKKTVLTKCPNCNSEYLTSKGIELYEENKKLKKECEELKERASIAEDNFACEVQARLYHQNEWLKFSNECEELKKQLKTSEKWRINAESLNEKLDIKNIHYRKALEEIEGLISDDEFEKCPIDGENCNYFTSRKILDIINKAKGAEDER